MDVDTEVDLNGSPHVETANGSGDEKKDPDEVYGGHYPEATSNSRAELADLEMGCNELREGESTDELQLEAGLASLME